MNAPAPARRDRLRAMLADLKMPGALEAVDGILSDADGGTISAAEAIEQLLNAQIVLRNNRRLQTAMRSSRRPAVKTLDQFDFASMIAIAAIAASTKPELRPPIIKSVIAIHPSLVRFRISSAGCVRLVEWPTWRCSETSCCACG